MLSAENVTVRYGDHTVVEGLSFTLSEGQWLMLAGPNGAGKSSLIAAIAQAVPYTGTVLLEGRNVRAFKPAMLARKIGVLSQTHHVGYAYTVEEIVYLVRYAHSRGFFSARDDHGEERVEEALRLTVME